tara:strand:- start:624 stop:1307 length:684 start_codon:yes stop_codon:yes gene_type:complete
MNFFVNPFFIIFIAIGIPILILFYEKNRAVQKNENYESVNKQLKIQADKKIKDAIELNGIIPISSNYKNQFNESLYFDKNTNLIVWFEAESIIFSDASNKVPRPFKRILDKFNQSIFIDQGWSIPLRDTAEDFIGRLAELDDALDFKVINKEQYVENKIVFSHTLAFTEKDGEPITQAFTIFDGKVKINSFNPNKNGTLALCIDSDIFFKEYGKNDPVKIGNLSFQI